MNPVERMLRRVFRDREGVGSVSFNQERRSRWSVICLGVLLFARLFPQARDSKHTEDMFGLTLDFNVGSSDCTRPGNVSVKSRGGI